MKASESRGDKVFVNYLENTVEGKISSVDVQQSKIYLKASNYKGLQPFEPHALLKRCLCCS